MHGKNTQATSCENEKADPPASAEQEEHISTVATDEKKDKSIGIPCGSIESLKQPSKESKTIEQAPLQEVDPGKEIHVSEHKTLASDLTDVDKNVSSSQQGEHNELLRRYYELEEQSQNVLQQLQQANYWDSQAPYYASTYQQPHVPADNATAQDPNTSTAQSPCCYWNCPMVSVSCCSASQPSGSSASVLPCGGCSVSLTCDQCPGASTTYPAAANFMQPPTKMSTNDDQATKAAMMAAESAFNFMRNTISGEPASQRKESETGKEGTGTGVQPNFDITGVDSDLAVVLNAWFVAGFHTGRYVEKKQQQQSNENSRQ
ncbi:hypothetical protein QOZ80_2BG0197420 [Eleusine coracana subsp. coracana]|nr:hypothetical protein QOZ80_2BG0197420 [Eleusine coracana subsp. coracana]